jgi:hypothetical protein
MNKHWDYDKSATILIALAQTGHGIENDGARVIRRKNLHGRFVL